MSLPNTPSATPVKTPVSVVIPTLNEAANLPRCLDHLTWADEVVVIDSSSRDATQSIARDRGAKVIDFKWDGRWPKKRNWTLRNAELKHSWILIVDADELIVPELAVEIDKAIRSEDVVGYYINRRFMFMGRWLKHCGYYPSWNLRLFKRGCAEYGKMTDIDDNRSGDNEVHEPMIASGPTAYLQYEMLHYAFPDVATFVEKHNRYSNWEAAVQYARFVRPDEHRPGHSGSPRHQLKNFSRSLPFRPTLRFLYSYVFQLGFMDGGPGLTFCRLLKMYEFLSVIKFKELSLSAEIINRPPIQLSTPRPPKAVSTDSRESTWSFREKILRMVWATVYHTLFRTTFHNWYAPRSWILQLFGARLGRNVRIRRTAHIEMPWCLSLDDDVSVGDEAILYALGPISIGAGSTVSQYAHLCAGTHDHTQATFPLIRAPITIGRDCWIAADAFIGPDVTIGDRTVIGARASVFSDIPADVIAVGNPARPIGPREFHAGGDVPAPSPAVPSIVG